MPSHDTWLKSGHASFPVPCAVRPYRRAPRGSILINIGRGGLVDEEALRLALDADKPAHAVLDVFKTEPLPAGSWFWDHPKVRVTPHASNRGELTGERGDALFLENLRLYLASEPLRNRVNPADIGVG